MGTFGLTFDALRAANLKRIPLFKNGKGEIAHPPIVEHGEDCGLASLANRCGDSCKQLTVGSDWSLGEWVTAVTGELGELANLIKKVRRGDLKLDDARPELAKELADVACYLDILALQCGVDLGDAVVNKFNEVSKRIGVDVMLGDPVAALATIPRSAELIEVLRNMRTQSGGWDNCPFCRGEYPVLDGKDPFEWHGPNCLLRSV